MKKWIYLITGILLACQVWAADEVLDGIAVIVGDHVVLRSEWLQTAQGMALQSGINPMNDAAAFDAIKKDVLRTLVINKLFVIKADEDTITVEDSAVEAELNNRINNLVRELGSEAQVEKYFGMPISQIRRDNRETIKEQMLVQEVQRIRLADVNISRHEVEKFYQTYKDSLPQKSAAVHLRHILLDIKAGSGTRAKATARMDAIREKIFEGESFEELAKEYSDDPGTAKDGGSLGWVEPGTLFESFEDAAFALEPGEISDIVETPIGLHIIKMDAKEGDKAKLRHILVRMETTENDAEEVKDMIYSIRDRILKGESFEKLAKEYSSDPSSKDQGGDLGWLPLDYLQIEQFKQVADTLKEGEISAPFLTRFGYHIVQLEGRRPAGPMTLEQDWDQIKNMALNDKQQRLLEEWVKELRQDVYIHVADGIDLDLNSL